MPLNLEMAATEEMLQIALRHAPHAACIVPEKREERTTEGGLDAAGLHNTLTPIVGKLRDAGIRVSLFIEANERQLDAALRLGVPVVEFHTGEYAHAHLDGQRDVVGHAQRAPRVVSAFASASAAAFAAAASSAATTLSRRNSSSPACCSSCRFDTACTCAVRLSTAARTHDKSTPTSSCSSLEAGELGLGCDDRVERRPDMLPRPSDRGPTALQRAASSSSGKASRSLAGGTRLAAGAPPGPGLGHPPTETGAQGT